MRARVESGSGHLGYVLLGQAGLTHFIKYPRSDLDSALDHVC